jgi:exodeoxyribonuclease VII small subunit
MDFEKNMDRLKEISSILQSDSVSLDQSLALVEEAQNLVKLSRAYLNDIEFKLINLENKDKS